MVHHQPVGFGIEILDNSTGLTGILLPRGTKPGGVGRGAFRNKRISWRGETMNHKTPLFNQIAEMAFVLTADKRYTGSFPDQSIGKSQAAHDMAGTDGMGSIGAKDKDLSQADHLSTDASISRSTFGRDISHFGLYINMLLSPFKQEPIYVVLWMVRIAMVTKAIVDEL